jgi:dipeptidyl aminopeptidase/acylaminoacyl peptidase
MQDDLLDAVDHLVAACHLDRDRVGIMGVSYGGYATLAALTSTDVFACGIARSAPANLITFIESIPPYFQPHVDLWHRRIGHPESDRALLWSRSPLSRARELTRPLLIVHGARDVRVPRSESDSFVAALEENGIEHEYLVFEDEGHGINQPHNREMFYEHAERFLARHLPAGQVE